jgi:hypothetical protein
MDSSSLVNGTLAMKEEILLDRELNDHLSVELGWKEVSKGLMKILMGYGLWVLGDVIGLILILMPMIAVGFKFTAHLSLGYLWMFYAGMGLLSVISIFSMGIIMGGKWKCIINASERHGCRWLIFLCLASMAVSAALSILSSLAGLKVRPELARGVAGLMQVQFSSVGIIFNLTSVGLGMLYTCTFALFLRAIAQCMESRWHVRMVDLFLSLFVPLMLATVYLIYRILMGDHNVIRMLLPLGAGWIICFVYWLAMIFMIRSCILKTMENVRDPITYSSISKARAPKPEMTYGL